MSIFLVLRPHHGDKGVRSPYAGLIGIHCIDPPDNDLIPVEQTCEKPSPNGGR
jgi:hypothetical protein